MLAVPLVDVKAHQYEPRGWGRTRREAVAQRPETPAGSNGLWAGRRDWGSATTADRAQRQTHSGCPSKTIRRSSPSRSLRPDSGPSRLGWQCWLPRSAHFGVTPGE